MSINNKQFQIVFEHSPMGMIVLNFSGHLVLSNKMVRTMFGPCFKGQSWDQTFGDLIHPEDRNEYNRRFAQLIEKPNSRFKMEARYSCGEKILWGNLAMTHVGLGQFSPFIFGIIEDVTKRKTVEEKLIREKEIAEKATETKSAFLANMSHEIRTPIHTITGMADLLLETRLDVEQQEYAGQIRYSADALLGLINDILDFSKIEAGKLSLELIECDLITLISETVDMISLLAHKKNLEMILLMDKEIPRWVMGDPTRIRQIILNLLSNAVKFTSRGEIFVRVLPVHRIGNRQSVRIEVQDTGIGIAGDKLNMLFQAFTQVDSSTTRKYGGTGLGLSISKSFIQLMNGIIDVDSQVGEGSHFWFTLPLDVVTDREEMVEPMVEETTARLRGLVVDDNLSAGSVTRSYLREWFHRVDSATTGKEALEKLRAAAAAGDPYHFATVDLLLPGMDGWHLASEVKNDKAIKETRLFLMSPLGMGTEAKMKLLGWFDGYLQKPVKRSQLEEDLLGSLLVGGAVPAFPREEQKKLHRTTVPRRGSILVAEDHPVNQTLFKTLLEKMGFQVLLAGNGREAVQIALDQVPDMIFMDIQMPEMNGYEATEEIRRSGQTLPIVAVTANALMGERQKCLAAGMNDFLTKPFKSQDLLPILEKWLPLQEGAAGLAIGAQDDADAVLERIEEREPPPLSGEAEDSTRTGNREPPFPPGKEKNVFNLPEALATFMGKMEVLRRVLRVFEDKTENQLLSMRKALDQGDWKSLEMEAHGIKGGSWNLEARSLGDAAALLEGAARNQDQTGAFMALSAVAEEFTELKETLSALPELRES